MDAIKIDKEFKSLIPPLSEEERKQLEANLLADGCREPLVVWNGTLLDGHNRYEICTANDIPFKTKAIKLDSRHAAKAWIASNQLGRRNLTPESRKYLIGVQYCEQKAHNAGAPKGNSNRSDQSGKNDLIEKSRNPTADRIGSEHGISEKTVRKAAKYANDVDMLTKEYGSEAKNAIVTQGRAGAGSVSLILSAPKKERDKMIKAIIEAPDKLSAKRAISKMPVKSGAQASYTFTGNWVRDLESRIAKLREMTKGSPSFWITMDVQSEIKGLYEFLSTKLKG